MTTQASHDPDVRQHETARRLHADFLADVRTAGAGAAAHRLTERLGREAVAPEPWLEVADLLFRDGYAAHLRELLDAAMARFPQHDEFRYRRGNTWRVAARPDLAEADFRAVLRSDPRHRNSALSLAHMLRETGRFDAAVDVFRALWEATRTDRDATEAALSFLCECGAQQRAVDIAEHAVRSWPEDPQILAMAGNVRLAIGDFDGAHAAYGEAVRRDRQRADCWLRLAHCKRYRSNDDPDLAWLAEASADGRLALSARIGAGFALGKVFDDLGETASAAQAWRDANTRAKLLTPWDATASLRAMEHALRTDFQPLPRHATALAPIFIVGLPRTGTTLVASRLARHPEIRDRGELNWIGTFAERIGTRPEARTAAALESVARFVAAQMRRDDGPAKFHIDQNPLNLRHLGLVAAMFPHAVVIHCHRNLRDTALSIWSHHFAHGAMAFAYDFAWIRAFADENASLAAHWKRTLPLHIVDLDYERFVSDEAAELARLAQMLGLSAEPMLVEPDRGDSVVTTASVWQVRQPTSTRSVGRWRRYDEALPELTTLFAEDERSAGTRG